MLNLINTLFKATVFGFVVLVLGNMIHWNGRTLSQHVQDSVQRTSGGEIVDITKERAEKVVHAVKDAKQKANSISKELSKDISSDSTKTTQDQISHEDSKALKEIIAEERRRAAIKKVVSN